MAQSLKDKDRLAVKDIQAAERQLGDLITYVPLVNRSSKEILSSYQVLNQQFESGIKNIKQQATRLGFDLSDVDRDYDKKFGIQNMTQKIIEDTTKSNQNNFSKIFSRDAIDGALLK